ncbi:MAG: triose-phosphate isomerase [Candidatus Schekmanbacteria bacterium]|nr:triose-phosphate isomerase [Candidatus Schekmanbacteria bacterium]
MRTPIIAGNWKMFKTVTEALEYTTRFRELVKNIQGVEKVIAPPFTALHMVSQLLIETGISLAAQNMNEFDNGAYTGEISPVMLKEIGCQYVIIGHSERRALYGETDEGVNRKLKAALKHQITPIMCIGESLAQREKGETFTLIDTQLKKGLADLTKEQVSKIVIAYEPVWAIGTGRTATPEQAEEVHAYIRQWLKANLGNEIADLIRIQYGGSVKPDNIAGLMAKPNIDGALVGGASLDAANFARIVGFRQ